MSQNPSHFLGISSYLHLNAIGHYLGVHTLYHEELENRGIPNKYLGAKIEALPVSWIEPKIDFIPTKLLNFDQVYNQIKMGLLVWRRTLPGGLNFVLEGNLNYWLILAVISRLKSSSSHVNLIRSDLVFEELILRKNTIARVYVKICNYVGKDFTSISTVSTELSSRLESIAKSKITTIPSLSGFRPKINRTEFLASRSHKKVLIFAPYLSDIQTLLRIIEKYPEIRSVITVSSWQNDEVMSKFHQYDIPTSNSHLTEVEYEELLIDSSHVVLFYLNNFHKFGSSAKVYDCSRLGISLCVPMQTAVEAQSIRCSNVFSFDGESDESILQAIINPRFENHFDFATIPDGNSAVSYLLANRQSRIRRSHVLRTLLGILALIGIALISIPVFVLRNMKRSTRRVKTLFQKNTLF
jgi:hypothetical protein